MLIQGLTKQKIIIFLILILSIAGSIFIYKNKYSLHNRENNFENNNNKDFNISQKDSLKNNPPSDEPKVYKSDQCILKREVDGKEDVIFSNANCNLNILKWSDYIIFPEGDGLKKEDVVLFRYNIKTGEKNKIYSLKENANDYNQEHAPYSISPRNVFGNTLFFGAGGYLTDQLVYSFDLLNITSKPKLISNDKQYSAVSYKDGHYWISGGMGDAGYISSKQALFDIEAQKIIGQEIKTSSNIGEGTEYVGANEEDAIIASFIKNPKPKEDVFETILSEVHSISLTKKTTRKIVISKNKVPADIKRVAYWYDNKSIILLGDDAYLYDMKDDKIKKIANLKGADLDGPNRVMGNMVCLSEHSKLDLKSGNIISEETNCQWNPERELQKKISNFNLPSEYSFECIKGEY